MSEFNLEEAKEVLDNFNSEVMQYIKDHELSDMPKYESLKDKDTIGTLYRDDQFYYETLSTYKANYYGLKTYFIKQKTETNDRVLTRKLESLESFIDSKIKHVETLVYTAMKRIKFYENIIYLVANMGYGDL